MRSETMMLLSMELTQQFASKPEYFEMRSPNGSYNTIFSVTELADDARLYSWILGNMPSHINLLFYLELPKFDGYLYIMTDPLFEQMTDIYVKHRRDEIRYIANFARTMFHTDKLLLIYLYHADKNYMLLPEPMGDEFEALVADGLIYEPCSLDQINS
jgi:hypothetical protein